MREKISEEKQVTKSEKVVVSKSVTCDRCGRTFSTSKDEDDYDGYFWDAEIQNFGASFGYGSQYDNENWSFDLCDNCLTEIIKSFKYPPEGFMYDGYSIVGERKQLVFDHWKETEKWDELYGSTYEEILELHGLYDTEYINGYIKRNFPDKPLITDEYNVL